MKAIPNQHDRSIQFSLSRERYTEEGCASLAPIFIHARIHAAGREYFYGKHYQRTFAG